MIIKINLPPLKKSDWKCMYCGESPKKMILKGSKYVCHKDKCIDKGFPKARRKEQK